MKINAIVDTANVKRIGQLKPGEIFKKLDDNYHIYMITYGGYVPDPSLVQSTCIVVVNLGTGILENICYFSYVKQTTGYFEEEKL